MVALRHPEPLTAYQRPPVALHLVNQFDAGAAEPEEAAQAISRPDYTAWGAAREYLADQSKEVVLAGPAGTGKTRVALEKFYALADHYPGARGLLLRQTARSLTASALVTFRQHVLSPGDRIRFKSARADKPAQYEWPNGSILAIGGMDDPAKVLSTDYDWIHFVEATETTLEAWETLSTRLRSFVVPYQQLSGDCNPGAPHHWLRERASAGVLHMLESRHEDNPLLWDRDQGVWTPYGHSYIETLDRLTGVRKDRLRFGRWVSAEGAVYEVWDPRIHLVDESELIAWGVLRPDGRPNRNAIKNVWAGVDWGYTNPGVIGIWAEDGDGRLYRIAEVYQTGRQVDPWWLSVAEELEAFYGPIDGWSCDPSEPAYIQAFRDAGHNAAAADNEIGPGIQSVGARLAPAGDGFPRLFIMRADPARFDQTLVERHLPTCTEQEIESYVWDTSGGLRGKGEKPAKLNDHGVDQMRYVVRDLDAGRPGYDSF